MIGKLLCFLGFHKWKYISEIEIGSERICERCDIKQVLAMHRITRKTIWYRIR